MSSIRVRISRYQTPTDEHIRKKCLLLKEDGLLQSVSIDRHHLTTVKLGPTSPPRQLKTLEDILCLFEDSPSSYDRASKLLKPPTPFLPPIYMSGKKMSENESVVRMGKS